MQVDNVHAVVAVGSLVGAFFSLAGIHAALEIENGLVFVKAILLLLSNCIEQFLTKAADMLETVP